MSRLMVEMLVSYILARWMNLLFNRMGVVRINIEPLLPRAFKYELEKRMEPFRKELFDYSPHYQWLDKEEWRVSLGVFGKQVDALDIERVCMAVEQDVFGFGHIIGITGKFETFPKEYGTYSKRNTVGLTFEKGSDDFFEIPFSSILFLSKFRRFIKIRLSLGFFS